MNEVISKLTDDERNALFTVALEQAISMGVDFDTVIGDVVRTYVENKMKKEEEAKIEEAAKEEEQKEEEQKPVVEEPTTNTMTPDVYDKETMKNVLISEYSEISKDVKEGYDSIDRRDYDLGGMLNDARYGRIIDTENYFKTHTGINPVKPEFREKVEKINTAMRAAYYAHIVHSSDEELKAEMEEAIRSYEELYNKGLEVERGVPESEWEKHSAATITFEDLEKTNRRGGVSRVGVESRKARRNPEDINEFDPLCYDVGYETARNILDPSDKSFFNHRITNEAKEYVQGNINRLRNMSISEYREFKLSQMQLKPNEKEKFDSRWKQNNIDESLDHSKIR